MKLSFLQIQLKEFHATSEIVSKLQVLCSYEVKYLSQRYARYFLLQMKIVENGIEYLIVK